MGIFSFIIFLLISLIILIIIGSVQSFALWCVTKKNNEFIIMIVPAILSIICFCTIIVGTFLLLKLFDIDAIKTIYSMIMKWEYSFNNYIYIILSYIISIIIFILIQAFCFKLTNVNYKKIYSFIIKKVLKKDDTKALVAAENIENNSLIPVPKKDKTNFFYYFAASLFSFAICFFSTLLLMYIGSLIGSNYILNV